MERVYDVGTFQMFLDALDDGCALFERDDRLALWNRRFQAHLPAGRELLERGVRFAALMRGLAERGVFPAAHGRIDAWLAERLAGFRSGGRFQERLSDGTIAEAREHLMPDGGLLIAVRDITELKRTEQALRDSEARFRDFADTAERLREAKTAAEAASAAKSMFLAHMSHELRTPLNAIIGFASILADQPGGQTDPVKTAEYARDIRESGMHLLALINDILDLSKIEAGKMTIDETEVVVSLVVEIVLRLVRSRADDGRIVLETRIDDDLPGLRADEMHVRQILVNLLSNAIKFTPPGGRIAVRGWRTEAGAVALSVSDTGVGMSEAELARLGTPFYQAETRDRRSQRGTGLGLSLTKEMVKLHGGVLAITSELGRGTAITITFPAERSLPRG